MIFGTIQDSPWLLFLTGVYLSLPIVAYILLPLLHGNVSTKKRIVIFVLGDLGHSPRICYHARSFAEKGWTVDLCGYLEEHPPLDLVESENIEIHSIEVIKNTKNLPFLIFGIFKVLYQLYILSSMLWSLRGANYILIQNPPSIPILMLSVLFKYLTKAKLIIDWHNLNFTILSIKLGLNHPFVKICKVYESFFARFADINLTVTIAMKNYLIREFNLNSSNIIVLYDKAASQFKPLNPKEKKRIFNNHKELFSDFNEKADKLIISSTSFTPDEDFNILIESLKLYDSNEGLPKLKVIITGKGPLKENFLKKVEESNFRKVKVNSIWLSAEDYPKVLALADIGISLHTSSSGIDLPMKVVDMFGCGIPVIALNFEALPELINSLNGKKVSNGKEIYENLVELFTNDEKYNALKENAIIKSKERWETNWKNSFGDRLI